MDRGGINFARLRITISLDLLVLSHKLFSEAHDEMCSNSAETVDQATARTIKYVSSAYLTMELAWWRECRSETTTSKDDGPKPEPCTTLALMCAISDIRSA